MQKEMILKELILMDAEILLTGTMIEGFLSYDTHCHLPVSCANRLFNRLQAQNPDLSIADLLVSRSVDQNTSVFVLNASDLGDARCSLSWDDLESSLIQVRA